MKIKAKPKWPNKQPGVPGRPTVTLKEPQPTTSGPPKTFKTGARKPKIAAKAGKPVEELKDPNTLKAEADATLQFGPKERELIDLIGQGKAHQTTIDRLYKGYQAERDHAQSQVDTATAAALAGMQQGAADSLAAAGAQVDQTKAAAATQQAATASDTGQQATTDQMVRQGLASAQESSSIQQDSVKQQGAANDAHLQRLGLIGEGQKQIFKENTTAYVNQLGRDQLDNNQEKAAFTLSKKGEYDAQDAAGIQQQIQNMLAEKSIASKDKATQLDYDIALKGLRVKQQQIEADISMNDADNLTSATNNDNDNRTTLAAGRNHDRTQLLVGKLGRQATQRENQRSRDFEAHQKQLDRDTDVMIAKMGGKSGGKASGNGTWKLPSGKTVILTPAAQEKWRSQAAKLNSGSKRAATIFDKLALDGKTGDSAFNEVVQRVQKELGVPRSVARAMAMLGRGEKITGSAADALAAYFPHGLIPGTGAKKVG